MIIFGVRRGSWARGRLAHLGVCLGAFTMAFAAGDPAPAKPDFNRDVHPVLSENCFACHGPDAAKRKAGLRLDLKESALAPTKSGAIPIVPGKPKESALYMRVSSTDAEERMPPAASGKQLTPAQVDTLRRWIEHGADYQTHWAFAPPQRPNLPAVRQSQWPRNPIDSFILARLEQEGLPPSPEAPRHILIRRLYFDLTGLPPAPTEVDDFLTDNRPNAYERLVDRLLASPHYGERMAVDWLDAARFADTHGYHIDPGRDMTHWREWVIQAFNANLPFDQFTVQQLAGDLLPNATREEKIASGFNRNHMINFEGGAIPEEYQTAYVVDRVNTTTKVWLGMTIACAQCHDHKFDPITQKDYYRLYAFFNHVPENGLDGQKGNAAPLMALPTPALEAKQAELKSELATADVRVKTQEAMLPTRQAEWEKDLQPSSLPEPEGLLAHIEFEDTKATDHTNEELVATYHGDATRRFVPGRLGKAIQLSGQKEWYEAQAKWDLERSQPFSYGAWIKYQGTGGAVLSKMADNGCGFDLVVVNKRVLAHLISHWPDEVLKVQTKETIPADTWLHLFVTYDGSSRANGLKIYVNGKERDLEIKNRTLTQRIVNEAPLRIGQRVDLPSFKGAIEDVRFYRRPLAQEDVVNLVSRPFLQIALIPPPQRSSEQKTDLRRYFREFQSPALAQAEQHQAQVKQQLAEVEKSIPTTMVMKEMDKPRDTFLLLRGQYDKHGEKVAPGVPAVLGSLPSDAPANRLGLAQWLVSRSHPLTARVIVNRYWQMYFGTGLVKTAEDFGSQGEWPSHPGLLDWLAVEFMEHGWDIKAMQKLIVCSATYRQSSVVSHELTARDPENRLLARGPRFRLQAEFIRDQALAISGLLNPSIGGPSVSPYQPAGLWEELASREDGKNWTAQTYTQSHGPDLYRRTMYTFWKRTSPPPTLTTFDAPDRETCTVRRACTDTPLQALVLMNDPTYLEAARKLAERLLTEAGSEQARMGLVFQLALARAPAAREQSLLLGIYHEQEKFYRQHESAARQLLGVGEAPRNEKLDPVQVAAWTIIANVILNLDETITKS